MYCMIQGSQKEHRHVSWVEHGRNLGGSMEQIIGKTIRTMRTIRSIRMTAGSRDMHRIQAKLFRKLWKHRKVSGKARQAQEGLGK